MCKDFNPEKRDMMDQEEESSKQYKEEGMESSEKPKEEESPFGSASVKPKQILITDEDLRGLQKELMEYKDKYLRLLADAENARKRLQKERLEISRHSVESLIIDFLRPLDNFENALRFAQEMSDEVKNWAFGFQMILTQFKDVLTQNGVIAIDSIGQPFNPHDHEAVEMVESTTQPPHTIVEECIKGYKMGSAPFVPQG